MGQLHRMSEMYQLGICERCFCFQGIKVIPDPAIKNSNIPITFPLCNSTQQPLVGYCTKIIPVILKASQQLKSTPKKSISKSRKVMVWVGDKQYEQGHFNDYLKQLKSERKSENG